MRIRNEFIKQEDPMGCGIACVAFLCDISYKTAKKKYFKNLGDANKIGYFCRDLVEALSKAGKKYDYEYLKNRTKFKENTIVFIKRTKRYPFGHYLVKIKDGWMDPWINFKVNNPNVKEVKAGFRKKLPGTPIYYIFQFYLFH